MLRLSVAVLLLTAARTQRVTFLDVLWFDNFGDVTSFIYTGGYAEVRCHQPKSVYPCPEDVFVTIIDPNGKAILFEQCKEKGPVTFRLNITDSFVLGDYKCGFKELVSSQTFAAPYRMCGDKSQVCIDELNCDSSEYCVVTSAGQQSCRFSQLDDCKTHEGPLGSTHLRFLRICPIKTTSLCRAVTKDYTRSWMAVELQKTDCPKDTDMPRLYYAGKPRLFNEPILLSDEHKTISFSYPSHVQMYESKFDYNITKLDDTNVVRIIDGREANVQHSYDITLKDEIFQTGSQIFRFKCAKKKVPQPDYGPAANIAFMTNTLVVIEGDLSIEGSDGNNNYECRLTSTASKKYFTVTYWWTSKKNEKKREDKQNIEITETDDYQCHAQIVYKTCAPYKKFERILHSAPKRIEVTKPGISDTKSPGTDAPVSGQTSSCQCAGSQASQVEANASGVLIVAAQVMIIFQLF